MTHRTGTSRYQFGLFATPLEEMIGAENPVRVIDAFVQSLDLAALGFTQTKPRDRGTPPYDPRVLLKIYLYGYYNRLRSSRKLEA
jgi:transposase